MVSTPGCPQRRVRRVHSGAAVVGRRHFLIEALEANAELEIVPTVRSIEIARWQLGVAMGTGDAAQHPLVIDLADRVEAMPDEGHSWAVGVVARAEAAVDGLVIPSLQDLDAAVRRLDG